MGKDPKLKIVPEVNEAIRQVARLEQQYRKLEQRVADSGRKSRASSREASSGFARATGALAKYAAGYLTVGTAISGVLTVLRELNAEQERGRQAAREAEFPLSKLAQLAGGDPAEYARMVGAALTSAEKAPTIEAAGQLQFGLESARLAQHREMYAGFYGIADPLQLFRTTRMMQRHFAPEGRGIPGITAGLFEASRKAMAEVEEFAPAMAYAAPAIRQVGGGMAQALGAVSVLTEYTHEPSMAARQLGQLMSVATKRGWAGQGLFGAAGKLEQAIAGRSEAEILKIVPNIRAARMLRPLLESRAEIEKRTAEIAPFLQDERGLAYIASMQALPEGLAETALPREEREAEMGLKLTEMGMPRARAAQAAEAIKKRVREQHIDDEFWWGRRLTGRAQMWWTQAWTGKTAEPRELAETYGAGEGIAAKFERSIERGARKGVEAVRPPTLNQVRDYGDRK